MEFREAKRGTHFDPGTGKLYLFEPNKIQVMVAWPRPMAWRKTRRRPRWAHFRPKLSIQGGDLDSRIFALEHPCEKNGQLLLPFMASSLESWFSKSESLGLRWQQAIPREVRDAVSPLPSRHWHMLSFLARCGSAALDLVHSNRALAFALASNWVFHKPPVQRPLRSARALLAKGKKQRGILGWLGFPPTEGARKVLRKVPAGSTRIAPLLYLRQGLADAKTSKLFSHLPRVNAGVIRIVTDPDLRPYAAHSLLEEVALRRAEDRRPATAYMLKDTLTMFGNVPGTGRKPPVFRSVFQLEADHEYLTEELNFALFDEGDFPFPPPPLPGTEGIVPITGMEELVREGMAQRNCVASYAELIAFEERVYIYRVLSPERCTLSITKVGDRWVLSELRLSRNREPSWITWKTVREWFAWAAGGEVAEADGFAEAGRFPALGQDWEVPLDEVVPF